MSVPATPEPFRIAGKLHPQRGTGILRRRSIRSSSIGVSSLVRRCGMLRWQDGQFLWADERLDLVLREVFPVRLLERDARLPGESDAPRRRRGRPSDPTLPRDRGGPYACAPQPSPPGRSPVTTLRSDSGNGIGSDPAAGIRPWWPLTSSGSGPILEHHRCLTTCIKPTPGSSKVIPSWSLSRST